MGEIFIPDSNSFSFRRIIFFLISPYYFQMTSNYIIFSIYFLLVCHCIKIKQNYFVNEFEKAETLNPKLKLKQKLGINHQLRNWNERMKDLINLIREVVFLNSFWSSYMSTYFVIYTLEISFVFYISITSFTYQFIPMIVFVMTYLMYLFKASLDSSAIEERNVKLFRNLRSRYFKFGNQVKFPIGQILKTGNFLEFERFFQRSSFKLLNGYRINTHLLELFFTSLIGISLRTYGDTIKKYFT